MADSIPAGTYTVDPSHSNVGFEIKHMGIATVRGAFKKFEGSVDDGRLQGTVEVASVDTGDPQRDGHLQNPDFFDGAQFPQITFASQAAEVDGQRIKLSGDITIKGQTRTIVLEGTLAEGGQDPWGNDRIGFEVETTIDRTDFGVSFNQALPNGSPLIGNDVKLVVSVSAVKS